MKEGWETKSLGEVSEVYDGPHATPKTVDYGPIFLGISSLQDGCINLSQTRHVTETDFDMWTRRVLPQQDDIVFSYETRLGQAAIIPEDLRCCLGRRMGLVRFKSNIVAPRFFLYQYISPQFRRFLDSKTIRGATVDRISIKDFPTFPISVPPLPEQQRIVALLDEAFAALATAQAHAARNLQNARALFESKLQSVFSQRGEGWVEKRLQDTCKEIFAGGDIPKNKHSKTATEECRIPIFTNGEKRDGLYGYTDTARVTSPSITISARGTIGYASIRNESYYPAIRLIVVIPDPEKLDITFLYYAIENIEIGHSGTSIPQLTVPMVRDFSIPFPPLAEQKEIATQLNALAAETQRLAQIYEQKQAALAALKQALLHQAFNGEL